MKSFEQLPRWFSLARYQRKLTGEQWARSIFVRSGFNIVHYNFERGDLRDVPDCSREDLLNRFESFLADEDVCEPIGAENTFPIRNMSRFESRFLAELSAPFVTENEKLWAVGLAKDPVKWLGEFSERTTELKLDERGESVDVLANNVALHARDVLGSALPILVDVTLDDENIRAAFDVWLAGVRDVLGPAKRPFGETDFQRWEKFGVLPVFDLLHWSKLSGVKLTDAFIGSVIWPDSVETSDFFDRAERIRKSTRPLIETLFSLNEASRLFDQMRLGAFLDKITGGGISGKDPRK